MDIDSKRIDNIIREYQVYPERGKIDHIPGGKTPNSVTIRGYCNVHPEFVNNIDREICANFWKARAIEKQAEYYKIGDPFILFMAEVSGTEGGVAYERIGSCAEKVAKLVKSHHEFAVAYNVEIGDPFIDERKKALEAILKPES